MRGESGACLGSSTLQWLVPLPQSQQKKSLGRMPSPGLARRKSAELGSPGRGVCVCLWNVADLRGTHICCKFPRAQASFEGPCKLWSCLGGRGKNPHSPTLTQTSGVSGLPPSALGSVCQDPGGLMCCSARHWLCSLWLYAQASGSLGAFLSTPAKHKVALAELGPSSY